MTRRAPGLALIVFVVAALPLVGPIRLLGLQIGAAGSGLISRVGRRS
jgi:hypothetical protein